MEFKIRKPYLTLIASVGLLVLGSLLLLPSAQQSDEPTGINPLPNSHQVEPKSTGVILASPTNQELPLAAETGQTSNIPLAKSAAPMEREPVQSQIRQTVLQTLASDGLAARQISLEKWDCAEESCTAHLRMPNHVHSNNFEATQSIASTMKTLSSELKAQGQEVSLGRIEFTKAGSEIQFTFKPSAEEPRYSFTEKELSKLRAETIKQYLESQGNQR